MNMQHENLPLNEEHPEWINYIRKASLEASKEAINKAHSVGLKVLTMDEKGRLVYLLPNGKKKYKKKTWIAKKQNTQQKHLH